MIRTLIPLLAALLAFPLDAQGDRRRARPRAVPRAVHRDVQRAAPRTVHRDVRRVVPRATPTPRRSIGTRVRRDVRERLQSSVDTIRRRLIDSRSRLRSTRRLEPRGSSGRLGFDRDRSGTSITTRRYPSDVRLGPARSAREPEVFRSSVQIRRDLRTRDRRSGRDRESVIASPGQRDRSRDARRSLHNLYERIPTLDRRSDQRASRGRASPLFRDTLAERYRAQIDRTQRRVDRSAQPSDAQPSDAQPSDRQAGGQREHGERVPTAAIAQPVPNDQADQPGLRPISRTARPTARSADREAGGILTNYDRPVRVAERRLEGRVRAYRVARDLPRPRLVGPVIPKVALPYATPAAYYSSGIGWHGAFISLSFSFGYAPSWCRWGLYSYPFYYCGYWPRWYYRYHCGFAYRWNASYPWYASSWWWPSSCYRPTVYVSYYPSYYPGGYGYPYAGAASTVVVREVEEPTAGGEVIAAGGEPAGASLSDLAEHHVSLGDFYFQEGRFEEAAESYLRALTYVPDDASIHFVAADALFATGDYRHAAFLIAKGLQLDPGLAYSTADKREFYTDPATFESQLAALRAYLAEHPFDAAAYLVLGYNLHFSTQHAEARDALQRALELQPGNAAAQALLDAAEEMAAAEMAEAGEDG